MMGQHCLWLYEILQAELQQARVGIRHCLVSAVMDNIINVVDQQYSQCDLQVLANVCGVPLSKARHAPGMHTFTMQNTTWAVHTLETLLLQCTLTWYTLTMAAGKILKNNAASARTACATLMTRMRCSLLQGILCCWAAV